MFILSRSAIAVFLLTCALFTALPASADPRTLGADFRRLLSNYHMATAIARECPELEMPALGKRWDVEKAMQEKIGREPFARLMHAITESSLRADALTTVEKLFEQVDGCDDERLAQAVARLASVHTQTRERFDQAAPMAAPQNVPVPLRRN